MAKVDATTDEETPDWLKEESLSPFRSLASGFAFVGLTLVFALVAEWVISVLAPSFSIPLGQNQLFFVVRADNSKFFAWDLAAILSMIVYFAYFWIKMFSEQGPLKSGGTNVRPIGRAIALLFAGVVCLFFGFLAAVGFAISIPHSLGAQLVFLTLGAYLIWGADRQVMKNHTDKKIKLEFKLFVEFVDIPMAICFTVLAAFYFLYATPQNAYQFSAFVSGAIAFQIIAFNVAFSFLSRFTKVITRGRTAVLLRNDGDLAVDYQDFKNSWWGYWRRPGES